MGMLLFRKPMQLAILNGTKRTTLRRWRNARVTPSARVWASGVGWIVIRGVEQISLSRLTTEDAQADGFATLTAMRTALRQCYPNTRSDGKRWYRVSFELEKK